MRDSARRKRTGVRPWLRRGAAAFVAVLALLVLSACGDEDDASESQAALPQEEVGERLREILGTPKALLAKGPGSFEVIGSWPLTGPGSIYGKLETDGFEFASEQIEAWTDGKLKFEVEATD